MTDVGFEPTHPKILVPKTSALDHSANQSSPESKHSKYYIYFIHILNIFKTRNLLLTAYDTLAEWLRRRPAKPLGFARESSNPSGVVFFRCTFFSFK